MVVGVLGACGAAVAFGLAAVLQALAAQREATTAGVDLFLLLRMLRHPPFLAAVALSLAGFGGHLLALRSAPLFLVQALVAGSVAVTAVLVAWWWGVRLSRLEIWAVGGLVVGLALVTTAASESDTPRTSTAARAVLLLACALLAGAGWAAGRRSGAWSAALLGALAGSGFAIVAVSGRVLPDLQPADVVRDPAAYALVVAGVLAFGFYSTALQRGAVLTSTGAMIVTQTAGPAVVGVVLLGDAVRPGWWAVALLGFALAVFGAVTLARHDPAVLEAVAAGQG